MSSWIIVLTCFISLAVGDTPHFPTTSLLSERIVTGNDSYIEDYPYQVSVRYAAYHTCGGGILNENTIITAGHCVYGRISTLFSVRVGSSFKSRDGQIIAVIVVYLHEEYDEEDLVNDIAILKLSENLVYGVGVQPIALPPVELELEVGTSTILAGWGRLQYGGISPDQLQSVILPVVDREVCAEAYLRWTIVGVGADQFCAGEAERDACQGDSGGPLVHNDMVVGLVSWGNECALKNYPSVFVRVASHIDWINQYLD